MTNSNIYIRFSTAKDAPILFDIWDRAVKNTHAFLNEKDFEEIATMVKDQYIPHTTFTLAVDETDRPLAFLGMSENENAYQYYLKNGFKKVGRSKTDNEGRPYPLIHMEYTAT